MPSYISVAIGNSISAMANSAGFQERLQTAFACHHDGRLADAEAIYRELLVEKDNNFDVLHLLGLVCYQAGRLEEADTLMTRALEILPRSAEAASNHGLVLIKLGQPEAALKRFRTAMRHDPRSKAAVANYLLGLMATKRYEEALQLSERQVKLSPGSVDAIYATAQALHGLGRYDEAERNFFKVLEIEPERVSALLGLAACYLAQERSKEASRYVAKVLELDPENPQALAHQADGLAEDDQLEQALTLAERAAHGDPLSVEGQLRRAKLLGRLERYQEAVEACEAALKIDARHVEALFFRGVGEQALGQFENALKTYQLALSIDPQHASSHWNEAYCQLTLGQLGIGFRNYEWRWNNPALGKKPRGFTEPLWLGKESLQNSTILLYSEQGFGDTFQFLRYVEPVRRIAARVLVEVPTAVVPLIAPIFGPDNVFPTHASLPKFDYQCPLPSLPLAFRTDEASVPSSVPYLRAEESHLAKWRDLLGERVRFRIGVAWSGNREHVNDANRSIPLEDFLDAFPPGVELVALQKEIREEDHAWLSTRAAPSVHTDAIESFADTAAIIELLDLVVCVDTGIAHIAGALNKETWVLLDAVSDWRWQLGRSDSPWYPSVKLYRQALAHEWGAVLKLVRRDLKERCGSRNGFFGLFRRA